MKYGVGFVLICLTCLKSYSQNGDAILGKWITETGNCIVEVFRETDEYKAKVVWFKNTTSKPMNEWQDDHNPDKNLRSRKLIGMQVLHGLRYKADDNEWSSGVIYDATTGKKWDSVVWLTNDHQLKVKGFWLFRWISQTKTFKRV